MPEIHLSETDRLDWALKTFKRQVQKTGVARAAQTPPLRKAERGAPDQVEGREAHARQGTQTSEPLARLILHTPEPEVA
jgi:hypothetical protein